MPYYRLPDIPIDFGPGYQPSANVDEAQFGDGYEQTRPAGINWLRDNYTINYSLLTRAEFERLDAFIREHLSGKPFFWQPPWDSVERQWRCRSWSGQRPTSARFASASATLTENFTPLGEAPTDWPE
ncbi:phage tail protein [Salinisphaera sp. T31B1]|uniref:phage tail protein n=1 Tax=Salinisphaera sp. T31B1 TaxID=727963 RepID=UPI00334243C1